MQNRSRPRKYPPHLQKFLAEFNDSLEKLGWIFENPDSRWASPAFPVKKPGSTDEYRQTVDYRGANVELLPMAGAMPYVQTEVEHIRGAQHFGLLDFIKGYWQLPLHEFSQEVLSYITHRKIYTPRRVPQGCCDPALYFQGVMERCFAELLQKHLLIWIDDLLLYAKDIDTYLNKMEQLFGLMNDFGFKLSAKKSELYATTVKWWGKIFWTRIETRPTKVAGTKGYTISHNSSGTTAISLCDKLGKRKSSGLC